MSETKENCPECGHFRPHHFKSYYIYDRGCFWDDCPCTRTYESLVGEKDSATDEAKTIRDWFYGLCSFNNPQDDGERHCDRCGGAVWSGVMTRHYIGRCTKDAKPEPSLQLLVIDLGGNQCVVKVEKGDQVHIAHGTSGHLIFGLRVVPMPFTELREAIDGVKPVPRIERDLAGYVMIYRGGRQTGATRMMEIDYDALSELAGKPLPIWEGGGTWEELGHIDDEVYNNADLRVWRYKRNENL